ncbi:MAG: hypothetical protein BAJALOKI1v1_260006 [Promethearchaeota archaeon]|nr:MAG: hypothetical protein BAJALOKI1v1_260006 [Candidatus Lokiarchaeota archaeon]
MSDKDFEKVDITIRSNTKDIFAFTKLVPNRIKRIKKASNESITDDPINDLAKKLHPKLQYLQIDQIIEETKSTRTYRLVPDAKRGTEQLAYFRAGQYLSLKVEINEEWITRPYSISSSPRESLEGYYEITIKKEEDEGFLTPFIWKSWKVGTKIISSGPEGFLYYEPLRDKKQILGLAGGSGITPFRSLAKSIAAGDIDAKLTLLYGCSDEDDIIFYEELKALEKAHPEKLKVVIVLSCEEITLKGCEAGFITKELIEKYADVANNSVFICGPQIMYDFIKKQLKRFNLPPKQIRREAFGEIKNISEFSGFPNDAVDKTFTIKAHIGGMVKEIPAKSTQSVLVALERARLAPPSKCRSGECGFCRTLLIDGNVYVSPISDWRREADKKFNYIHACSSYPITDLELIIPRTI